MERLQHFEYDVEYVPGPQNEIADYVLRLNERAAALDRGADTSTVDGPSSGAIKGICMDDIRATSQRDEDIQSVTRYLKQDWPHGDNLFWEMDQLKRVSEALKYKD